MADEGNSGLLKINEAAQYLGVTRRWVYRRIWSGDLSASKVGGFYFIRKQDLDALISQGRTGGMAIDVDTKSPPALKCGYCFRLLESDSSIGEVCAADGCEALICNNCLAEGIRYCANHTPDREQLWETALEQHREGKLPVLVKANQARLRELNFIQRVGARLYGINTLRHPLSAEVLTVKDWHVLCEEGDERYEIMTLMNKGILETEWQSQFPLNARVQYRIPPFNRQKGPPIGILAQALSEPKEMIQKGFATRALGVDDLTPHLIKTGQTAQKNQTITLAVFASTTGWDEDSRKLIQGEAVGSSFVHQWMLVYLKDLERRELIYKRFDDRIRSYADLFTSLTPEEEVEEISVAIEKEIGIYESFTLQQALQVLPYPQKSIEKAFVRLADSGRYALTEVPGMGQAIVREITGSRNN